MDALPIARFEPAVGEPAPQRTTGELEVVFRRHGDTTVVDRLYQDGAGKARLPRERERGLKDVTLINLAGGLTGGDVFRQRLVWQAGAQAGATTQAAEKIYRAAAGEVRIRTALEVAAGAWAEWLPQETILFEGAALDRRLTIDLAGGGRLLAVEPVVFGRIAMGERVRRSHLTDRLEVRVDGRRVWLDVNRLAPPVDTLLDRPALGGGARAVATVLYVAADAGERLAALRAVVDDAPITAGVSRLGPVAVARLVAAEPAALRRALVAALGRARAELGGWPARLPRAWHI
jgi:urease accessory protein